MNILKSLFSFFRKNKLPKNTTTVNNTEISDKHLTQTELILKKKSNGESLSMTDINLALSDLLNIKSIDGTIHKLNKTLIDEAVFTLHFVHFNIDKNDVPISATVRLEESVFNLKMDIVIDASTFHEVFTPVKLTTLK